MAKDNPEWYCELLSIEKTYGNGGTVGPEDVEAERRSGMSENLIQQEYYVSFDAAVENAVLGEQMSKARAEGRITNVPYDSRIPSIPIGTLGGTVLLSGLLKRLETKSASLITSSPFSQTLQ